MALAAARSAADHHCPLFKGDIARQRGKLVPTAQWGGRRPPQFGMDWAISVSSAMGASHRQLRVVVIRVTPLSSGCPMPEAHALLQRRRRQGSQAAGGMQEGSGQMAVPKPSWMTSPRRPMSEAMPKPAAPL